MPVALKHNLPTNAEAVLDLARGISSFTGWDGKTALTITDIKTYCVPGNDPRAKGRTAIWVRSPKAKRPRILFPEVVLLAMRFIADPKTRGKHPSLHPSNFSSAIIHSRKPERHLPGLYENDNIYIALARRLLGLPDDYQDEITVELRAAHEKERLARRPNVRTIDGLMQDTILAYVDALVDCDDKPAHRDWCDLAYRALWRRHSRSSWLGQEAVLKQHLQETLNDVQSDPGHKDIQSIDIAVFAMLYTNGLCLTGAIRSSAITTVVNRLADAADDGALDGIEKEIRKMREEKHHQFFEACATFETQLRRLAHRRR